MNPAFFIARPIFAAVLSVVILMAGLAAQRQLPVAQFPEITPPQIQVTTVYPAPMPRPWPKPSPRPSSSR